jgi:hypothetical protein
VAKVVVEVVLEDVGEEERAITVVLKAGLGLLVRVNELPAEAAVSVPDSEFVHDAQGLIALECSAEGAVCVTL